MTSTQKISVIIPTHNRPDTVIAAVRSVLAQTWRDLELFVIDVGVKDRAEDALREFSSDPRFHYVKHPVELRGGAARNIGAKLAQGQWLAFLDDDDEWFPKKLEIQMEAISRASHDVGFCFSGVVNDFGDRQEITRVLAGEQDLSELAFARFKGFLTVTLMIRRDVYAAVGGFDEMLPSHQDPELILRIAQRWRGLGVDQPLVSVNMHPGRDHVGGDLGRRIEGRKMVLQKHAAEYAKRPAILARHWFQIGLWEREGGEKKAAAAAMMNAFRTDRKARYFVHLFINGAEVFVNTRSARIALQSVVSAIFVVIAVSVANKEETLQALQMISILDIFLFVLLIIGTHFFSALRWKYMLISAGYTVKLSKILLSYFANIPATKVFPSYVGDYLRIFYLRAEVPVAEHAGFITAEAFIDVAVLGMIACVGGLFAGEVRIILLGVFTIFAALFPITLLYARKIFKRGNGSSAKKFLLAFSKIQINSLAFLIAVLLTFMSWGTLLGTVLLIFLALGAPITFLEVLAFQPAVLLLTILPITIGGIGIRETTMSIIYGSAIGPSVALAAGAIQTMVSVFLVPILALPIYLYVNRVGKTSS